VNSILVFVTQADACPESTSGKTHFRATLLSSTYFMLYREFRE
jgi:hypothetical protein